MLLSSKVPKPHLLLTSNNFSFFSYMHHQWWSCLDLHPTIPSQGRTHLSCLPLGDKTMWNIPEGKAHPSHMSNHIFIDKRYRTPYLRYRFLKMKSQLQILFTEHWNPYQWVSSLYFTSLLEFFILLDKLHVYMTSHVIKCFLIGGNTLTILPSPTMKNTLENLSLCIIVDYLPTTITWGGKYSHISLLLVHVLCSLSPLIRTSMKHQQPWMSSHDLLHELKLLVQLVGGQNTHLSRCSITK